MIIKALISFSLVTALAAGQYAPLYEASMLAPFGSRNLTESQFTELTSDDSPHHPSPFGFPLDRLPDSLYFKDRPIGGIEHVSIFTTLQCPLECSHCYWLRKYRKMPPMTKNQLRRIIREVNKLQDLYMVSLNGGEPFTNQNLIHIALKELQVNTICILTNGYWATTPEVTHAVLQELESAAGNKSIVIQVSINQFVLEQEDKKNRPLVPIENIFNIIKVASTKCKHIEVMLTNLDGLTTKDPSLDKLRRMLSNANVQIPATRGLTIDFVGTGAELDPIAYEQRYTRNIVLSQDFISIYPSGTVSIHPILHGTLDSGNIYDEKLSSILNSMNSDILLYYYFQHPARQQRLIQMACSRNQSLMQKLENVFSNPGQLRIALEDPATRRFIQTCAFWELVRADELRSSDDALMRTLTAVSPQKVLAYAHQEYRAVKGAIQTSESIAALSEKTVINWFDIQNPQQDWQAIFDNNHPITLYIGNAHEAIIKAARENKQMNYVWVHSNEASVP